ncbi:MAG: Hint domain-containing protein [Tabrizicola sp.]
MDTTSRISGQIAAEIDQTLTGALAGTFICTLDGLLPVEFLQPGDRVVTRAGARRIAAISVLRRKAMDLVRIRSSVLGPDQPAHDLFVALGQPVIIRDWRARALYGSAAAAIPAARLVDDEFVLREKHGEVRLFTLRFDEDEVIYADGLELACPAYVQESQRVWTGH